MTNQKILVALGGNAILTTDASAAAQQKAVQKTAAALVQFVLNGDQLVVTHGNGPQVGNLLLQQLYTNSKSNPAMPLHTVGAMTEGSIGYWFQNALQMALLAHGFNRTVVTLVTQVLVAENDPAFNHPSKPIGPFYSATQLDQLQKVHPDWQFVADAGRGYRRVVPSPKPIAIQEYPAIKTLLDNQVIPIVAGGGGVPVVKKQQKLVGEEAVIDKDFSAAKVAELINADKLIILTSVAGVFYHFGTPNQIKVKRVTVKEIEQHIADQSFAAGSMLPKVEAAISFVKRTKRPAIIGALADVNAIIKGEQGTVIVP